MKWFFNLTTKAKLIVGFGIIILMIILMFLNTQNQMQLLWKNQSIEHEKNFKEVVSILRINININAIKSAVRDLIISDAVISKEALQKEIEQRIQTIQGNLTNVKKIYSTWSNSDNGAKVEELTNLLNAFTQTVIRDVVPRVLQDRNKEAQKIVYGIQVARYKRIKDLIQDLQDTADADAEKMIEQSKAAYSTTITVSLIIVATVLGLSILIIFLFIKVLSIPLNKVAQVTNKIAAGDLNVKLETDGSKDELGTLTTAFNKMVDSLRDMIQDVSETISVLGSASVQISTSSSQLAASSNETATSVTETTATVEEVRQTTNVTNIKARQVAESAQRATHVSTAGKKLTDETIEGINKIGNQMESIAESIIKLSEQSRAISDIISSVNDLAEQTNLLAVNASIEAARAGEQGKGFVVVAQEIKSLADQSKQATTQVRTILNDIQNAISAAVMATEQGSKIVEAGIKQSNQTGVAIQSIAESINEAAQLAVQISVSSQEQSVGMDQVALAMENIKFASVQNAQTTKQLESSAISLKKMGDKLKELVQNYKV
jgi:methyl-accepting chemotaxis protein